MSTEKQERNATKLNEYDDFETGCKLHIHTTNVRNRHRHQATADTVHYNEPLKIEISMNAFIYGLAVFVVGIFRAENEKE